MSTHRSRSGMSRVQVLVLLILGVLDFIVISIIILAIINYSHSSSAPITPPTAIHTIIPTAIPPTTIPTATPDLALKRYLNTVHPRLDAMADALGNLAELMTAAGNNPDLILDTDWENEFNAALENMDIHVEGLRTIQPPAVAYHCHEKLLTAADQFNLVTAYLSYGLTANDAQAIYQSSIEIEAGSRSLEDFTYCIIQLH